MPVTVEQALQFGTIGVRGDGRVREQIAILLFLLASSIFMFVDSKVPPVALQDSARNAINAIEMHIRGFSLVTTFNFQPDLWNTKPPLLIWLMSGSMDLFGPSEWSLRLPSALAALGILCCTLWFVRRVTGSLGAAMAAATLLLLSPGFFGEHGARTADFDGPLTFFVTLGLQLLFLALHQSRPGVGRMIAVGAAIAAGALTKSIAAFIPVAGVLAYLVAVGRLRRTVALWHRYTLAAAIAVAPLAIFYAAREAAGPGYLAAVVHNDILGRFSEALIEPTSPVYYVQQLFLGWFVAGPFLVVAPLAFATCSKREKLLFLYSASIVAASLLVFSAASNRAIQYALPMFPWLAILGVFSCRYLAAFVARTWRKGSRAQAAVLCAVLALVGTQLTYRAAVWRYERFPARQFYPQSSYGDLFADLAARKITRVTVVDPGVRHLGVPGYAPLLRWNQLIWEEKGLQIDHQFNQRADTRAPLASCEPRVFDRWSGPSLQKIGSCAVLWRAGVDLAPRPL